MTIKILAAGLLLFSFISVRAQTLHVGVKTDLNFTKISGKGMDSKFHTGYQAGAFAEIDFNKKWGLQPEVSFSQRNTKRADDFGVYYINAANSESSQTVRLSYISIPILAKYNINKLFSVNFGPQYSYLVYDNEDLLKANQAAFKKNDFSLVAGVQLNLSESFRVYGRYSYGLLNINSIDDRYKYKTQQLQLGIGVHIF